MTAKFDEVIRSVQEKGAQATADELIRNVEEEFGSAPLIYKKLEDMPEALISHLLYKNAIGEGGCLRQRRLSLSALLSALPFAVITVRSIICGRQN